MEDFLIRRKMIFHFVFNQILKYVNYFIKKALKTNDKQVPKLKTRKKMFFFAWKLTNWEKELNFGF